MLEKTDAKVEIHTAKATKIINLSIESSIHPLDITMELFHLILHGNTMVMGKRTYHLFHPLQLLHDQSPIIQEELLAVNEKVIALVYLIHHTRDKCLQEGGGAEKGG